MRLRITAYGASTEVHLHGYDLQGEIAPGEPATFSVDADLTWRFEIEDHEPEKALGVLLAQLCWVLPSTDQTIRAASSGITSP